MQPVAHPPASRSTAVTFQIAVKRIYESPSPTDGCRILVDRLWPRGVSKARAHLDAWMKEVAPSTELRLWFGHLPERWPEFRRRYIDELTSNAALGTLKQLAAAGPVTLLYAAKDAAHNEAVVLAEYLSSGASTIARTPSDLGTRLQPTP